MVDLGVTTLAYSSTKCNSNSPNNRLTAACDCGIIANVCNINSGVESMAGHSKWANIQLVCSDAAQIDFPSKVDAVVSTYTLTLVPDCGRVISNALTALAPGGRLVILDMSWPKYCPLWWRHVLFFLRSYGVTADVLRRRPWEIVQRSMKELFQDFSQRQFWFGFFYLACGTAGGIVKGAG